MAESAYELNVKKYDTAWSIMHEWWQHLKDDSGNRAMLRRARNPDDVAIQYEYLNLFNKLAVSDIPEPVKKGLSYRLPLIAGILSHVKVDDESQPVAYVLGSTVSRGSARPLLSDLRFRRLMRTEEDGELFIMMIRIVKMMSGKANVKDLSESIFFWNESTRKRWASQYYLQKNIYTKI